MPGMPLKRCPETWPGEDRLEWTIGTNAVGSETVALPATTEEEKLSENRSARLHARHRSATRVRKWKGCARQSWSRLQETSTPLDEPEKFRVVVPTRGETRSPRPFGRKTVVNREETALPEHRKVAMAAPRTSARGAEPYAP